MDLVSTTHLIVGLGVSTSAVALAVSAMKLRQAFGILKTAKDVADDRFHEVASDLLAARYQQLAEARLQIVSHEATIDDLHEVIKGYRDGLIGQIEENQRKATLIALYREMVEEIDVTLRTLYPGLPENYEVADTVAAIVESLAAGTFVSKFGEMDDVQGVMAQLIQKIVEEGRGFREELDESDGIIKELQDDNELLTTQLNALKSVANDDSKEADLYAGDLRKADEVIHYLNGVLQASGVDHMIPTEITEHLAESAIRTSVIRAQGRGEGAEIKAAA